MHKAKKVFSIIVLLSWIVNLAWAAPAQSNSTYHKPAQHHTKKKSTAKHKKNLHKKSSSKKKTKKNTHHRVMKPNIVKKPTTHAIDSKPELKVTPAATAALAAPSTPPSKPHSIYRILTQPMSSQPATPSQAVTTTTLPPVEHKMGFAASIEHRLVDFVHKTVSSLRYSTYKLGGSRIDASQGIYIVDCSGYVDHTLRVVYPKAYFSLVGSSGVDKPNTSHYYNFFTNLSNDPNQFWSRIEDIEQLRPGDILVFRYKNVRGRSTGGHVMVVMNKPQREGNAYLVSVTDSAASGHSEDTRQNHVSGIGIGTILLKVNPKTRQPSAFAWTFNSPWRNNVSFAMARPLEMNSWSTSLSTRPHEYSHLDS